MRTVHHLDTFTTPELVACHERAINRPFAHVFVSASVASELAAGWGIKATVIPNGVASTPQDFAASIRAAWDARRDTAAAGVALAERHTWPAAAAAHVELYRSLTDPTPAAGSLGPGSS
ncbi:hypothetical protein VSH64_08590 [Amycolatopsis rhabdoformis]|uniref:Glycosyltransferase family 4 protein n=1 Tax=Amycolatopsis rhabdoformis TaxID=1448059 RepID=A0ABZ1ICK6_9PSEU|nr:hypothetical protein [Amycolatopsis rhabdoformis]WSE32165.1 hypothetical protein VSH64_08590 [Amycolatopsis rhabdoformis]